MLFRSGGTHYRNGANFSNVQPGTQFAYSDWGYALLGYLVERISSVPFNQYCRQNIFLPLCMNHTGWYFSEIDSNIVSRPYQYNSSENKYLDYGLYEYPDYPDGQIKTTVTDLSRYLLMHMNYGGLDGTRILDSTTVVLMRTVQVVQQDDPLSYKFGWGLGFNYVKVYQTNKEYWGHQGWDNGIRTQMWDNISDGTGTIIFTNCERDLIPTFFFQLDNVADTISSASCSSLNCSYSSSPCEHSANYWKTHSGEWALNAVPMKIGTKHYYTKNQMLDVLNLPVNGDASRTLAKTLLTAKLNVAQGSELSPIISTINAAMSLLGDKRIPFDVPVPFSSATGIQMLSLAATLSSYNSGAMNVTACTGSSLREEAENFYQNTSGEISLTVFPNPVSALAVISFSLPQSQNVSIKIFD